MTLFTFDMIKLSKVGSYSRSVCNKISFIHTYLLSKLLDVVCLTETWLNCEHYDNEVLPVNYRIFRRDRKTGGPGEIKPMKIKP